MKVYTTLMPKQEIHFDYSIKSTFALVCTQLPGVIQEGKTDDFNDGISREVGERFY